MQELVVASDPGRARVFADDDVVIKLYPGSADPQALSVRLAAIQAPPLVSLWAQPLIRTPVPGPDGRWATVWRRGQTLEPSQPVPWRQVAEVLARLHAQPAPDAPTHLGHQRLGRAVAAIRAAGGSGPAWLGRLGAEALDALGEPSGQSWIHGDFHLGQLARLPGESSWSLLDPDDLGRGDPAWDLGRLAGFWAAGLLDDDSWDGFLTAYREAGGPGVPSDGDPWPRLELPARAAVIIAAIGEWRRSPDGFDGSPLRAACRRMVQ